MHIAMIRQLVAVLVLVVAVPYMMNQVRRPTRWIGRLFVWGMNRSHSALTDWGLERLQIGPAFTILDVGCGGGRTVRKLSDLAPQGKVFGIDYAPGSIAASRAENAEQIEAGRVEILEVPISRLPFHNASFDVVTAVETHYYWPDLPHDLREVLRVVKPGGSAIVIAETYRGSALDVMMVPAMKLLRAAHLTQDEHREWFATAGFSNVEVFTDRVRGWICVTGRRPEVA